MIVILDQIKPINLDLRVYNYLFLRKALYGKELLS